MSSSSTEDHHGREPRCFTFRSRDDVLNEEEERTKTHLLEEFITMIQTDAESEISLQCPMMHQLEHTTSAWAHHTCLAWGYYEEIGFTSDLDVGRWVSSELLSGQNDLVLCERAEVTMIQESHLGQTGRKPLQQLLEKQARRLKSSTMRRLFTLEITGAQIHSENTCVT